ncbi:MAG: FAD-dependent oxidoreductase [bacterium]
MEKENVYDLIILGAGPAGLAASIYASRYLVKNAVVGSVLGGKMSISHKICNYPGVEEISGSELILRMKKQAEILGSEIFLEGIKQIKNTEEGFEIDTKSDKKIKSRRILIALGTESKRLNAKNEEKFIGRGVSYCATCDGAFFKGRVVAVLGGGDSGATAALYLADLAEKVYLIHRGGELRAEKVWQEEIKKRPKIEMILNNTITELQGSGELEAIVLQNEYNGSKILKLDGLFVEIGYAPADSIVENLKIATNERGQIKIKQDGSTNIKNVWAAGDITDGSNSFRQIITACAEGAIAANAIYMDLQREK